MREYTAVILDMAGSKKLPAEERNRLQERLVRINGVLNGAFTALLAKDVDFSGGDEVQGLFYSPAGAYLYCRLLEICLLPWRTHVGIGTGAWDVQVPSRGSAAQDGPAYHLAREAVGQARRSRTQSLCMLPSGTAQTGISLLINASIAFRAGLSAGQLDALRMMEVFYPFNTDGLLNTRELSGLLPAGGSVRAPADIALARGTDIRPEERVVVRNMVSDMAGYAGSSVQNMSRLIRKGNLLAIRAMDYYAACALLEITGGGRP